MNYDVTSDAPDFGHGFASAGITEAFSGKINNTQSVPGKIIAAAIVGGTASVASGGKFGNGAITAAFSSAFGSAMSRRAQSQAMEERMAAAASFDADSALAYESLGTFYQEQMQEAYLNGEITVGELNEFYMNQGVGAALGSGGVAIGMLGRAAFLGAGVFARNVSIDGPNKGFLLHGNGRIIGMRWKGGQFGIRLDFHPLPGTQGQSVLHLNWGSSATSENNHLILVEPNGLPGGGN